MAKCRNVGGDVEGLGQRSYAVDFRNMGIKEGKYMCPYSVVPPWIGVEWIILFGRWKNRIESDIWDNYTFVSRSWKV